jgi:CRP/FNR family cyclic AMP-dependent transcriptional regulator
MIPTLEPVLQECPFFSGLSDAHLKLITASAKHVHFREHHYIFREGDRANEFYVICDGLVSIELFTPSGSTTVQTVEKGEVLGWSWVSPPYRWHFNAKTLRPTDALVLDGNWLRAKCEEDRGLGYEMLKRFANLIAERLDATRLQLRDIYSSRS